jgi:signal transduction histidine kinase
VLFVVVLAETVLSPSREARPVYAAAGIALLLGTWPVAGGGIAAPAPAYFFEAGTRLFFLTIVGVLMRRIREVAQAREAELANLRAELAAAGERAHLSREIHDGIGNTLAAAVLRLEVAARVGEKRPEEVSATLLREEAQALRGSMNALRDWTFFARPWSRPDGGAGAAALPSRVLEQETARFGQRTGIPVVVEGADALDAFGPNAQLALLRIVQEALTNAAKHAGAGRSRCFCGVTAGSCGLPSPTTAAASILTGPRPGSA